jgi:hypothetical protein
MSSDRGSLLTVRSLPLTGWVCCRLLLLGVLMGCKPAPVTNRVVVEATSPDGRSVALLVDRYYHAALAADEFFLIVIRSTQSADQEISNRHIGDRAALVATWASKVEVRWQSNDILLVTCDSCGLKPNRHQQEVGSHRLREGRLPGFP